MKPPVYYEPVSIALEKLRLKGFTVDFNLEKNCIVCHPDKFTPEDFEVVEIYRYEGDTDPADEATVYGIQSTSGMKGVLVTGYGTSMDSMSEKILEKLKFSK
ncbi:MAG: hypothetical protein ACHQF2_03805 [Flavobacteriales bacterium]